MDRRGFVAGGALAGTVALAAPAIAQGALPEIRWRCASSFPRSLDTIFGAGDHVGKRVAALTDGRFQIRVFPAGELVPGLAVADAVQAGTVDCGHTASYYFVGKDPTFAFDATIPFGMNTRQINAWLYAGGGRELLRDFFAAYNIVSIPCGSTGAQMGGWFRKEVRTVQDLQASRCASPASPVTSCRSWAACRSRSPAATSTRRWRRARSMRRNGSAPMTTRSWASSASRPSTTTPAGGRAG
jgi:TRAP-type mannitol/chloroaromatic compound transport system substrate-binding protein